MGWQDRDWAKWTDEERRRYVGGGTAIVPGAFAAVVVSLIGAVVFMQPFHASRAVPPPIYGNGVVEELMGRQTTCTKQSLEYGKWTCDAWTMLLSGQRALPAAPLPDGSLCTIAVADQASRRWICATPS